MSQATIFDNPVTRRLARTIESGDNALLGTSSTQAVARRFNRIKNRDVLAFRRQMFAERERLFAENGPVAPAHVTLEDGWALDTTHSLPHLDRMLADADAIITSRGGVNRGGGNRSFFQQLLTDDLLEEYPSILDFATSNAILRPIVDYLGFIPTMSGRLPIGIRLNESDQRFVGPFDGVFRQSQLFHCDYHDRPMVYALVCLRDVAPDNGPFSFFPKSVSDRARIALRYGARGRPYRVTDEEMYAHVDRSELIEFAYPKGTVLYVDNSQCFHYGSRNCQTPRYLLMLAYVSVCRTDFTDLLRKEATHTVPDTQSRVARRRYGVNPSDSRLRKMVLDRDYLDR